MAASERRRVSRQWLSALSSRAASIGKSVRVESPQRYFSMIASIPFLSDGSGIRYAFIAGAQSPNLYSRARGPANAESRHFTECRISQLFCELNLRYVGNSYFLLRL